MMKLRIPRGVEWELLVVNNNSTDDTEAVLARYAEELPLRPLFESKQGHSHARNCAIDAALGELLIWTDDDVLVDENWLAEYVRAASAWPEATYFGGRIDPWYEVEPPNWFRKHERALLPLRWLGQDERLLCEGEYVFGANMAFRRTVLMRYPFDPRLGRTGDEFVLGDETMVIRAMRRDNHSGVWIPSATVRHFVSSDRLARKCAWRYVAGLGRMNVRMHEFRPSGRELFGAPRWLYLQYAKALAAYYWQRATLHTDTFPTMREAAFLQGTIIECRDQNRRADTGNGEGKVLMNCPVTNESR